MVRLRPFKAMKGCEDHRGTRSTHRVQGEQNSTGIGGSTKAFKGSEASHDESMNCKGSEANESNGNT